MSVAPVTTHAEAERALLDLWADSRDDPLVPAEVVEMLAGLLTSGNAVDRKVMAAELVLAHADCFSAECRLRAAALADFAVAADLYQMASSGRGAAIAALLRDVPGAVPVEPVARFVLPVAVEEEAPAEQGGALSTLAPAETPPPE